MDPSPQPAPHASSDADRLIWTVHPVRDDPRKGVAFWTLFAAIIYVFYWNLRPELTVELAALATALAAAVLLVFFSDIYLPTTFTIDERGVAVERRFHKRRFEWAKIRSAADERKGLFLSPFATKTRLENFRGVFLKYAGNREAALAQVRRFRPDLPGLPGTS